MDLTIEECQFLLNAVNAQAKAGFQDGLNGSQKAMVVAMKLQTYAASIQSAAGDVEQAPVAEKANGADVPEAELVE